MLMVSCFLAIFIFVYRILHIIYIYKHQLFIHKHESPFLVFEKDGLVFTGHFECLTVDGYLIIPDGIDIVSAGRKLGRGVQDFALLINLCYRLLLVEKYAIGGELAIDSPRIYI